MLDKLMDPKRQSHTQTVIHAHGTMARQQRLRKGPKARLGTRWESGQEMQWPPVMIKETSGWRGQCP